MSDSDEESFSFYGKPLEQYDEDSIPKRKPIPVEDQIATDDHGRRRFHGAFTGGFSAGFFNTVGSLEGWKPTEFKSSRSEKAERKVAKPEDFMDDEDMGEHGFAPQTVRATKDYSTSKKRKKAVFSEGPIPGIPVLQSLIEAGNETIGYLLMKNMDLKKKKEVLEASHEGGPKVYGCVMPKTYEIERNIENDDIIPNIFRVYIKSPKSNTFGLGYSGLDKSELSLRKSTQLVVKDQNNRKLAISGQAFGVGAFENDDEDIYAKDDMSQYDFEITKEKKGKNENRNFNHPEFIKGSQLLNNKKYPPPTIPQSFSGKHKIRKSRFEPIHQEEDKKEIKRKDMNAAIRAKYIGEEVPGTSKELFKETPSGSATINKENIKKTENVKIKQESSGFSNLIFDKFVSASISENPHDILAKVEPTYTEHGTKEMRDAAKLKMYGPLTRVIIDWQPCSLVCKRFNVKEPVYDENRKDRGKKKNQIFFEYEKHKDEGLVLKPGLINTKEDTIIEDKNIEEIKSVEEIKSIMEPQKEQIQDIKQSITEIDLVRREEISEGLSLDKKYDEPKQIQETDKIDVAKNIDLFKAVFLSSSESESEDEVEQKSQEDNQDSNLIETITKTVLTEDLIIKFKPRKEGILSNINFTPLSKPETSEKEIPEMTTKDTKVNQKEETKDPLLYGPALPVSVEKTCVYVPPKINSKPAEEQWVEKDLIEKIQKHKKKHKKEKKKSKDKKHKKSKHRK
ncbi:G patch domain-containing protein 1 homolog [Onthophagus taurus]|uniref:G patch domain-containing protein 1 homolog n=1 Tax=Onthophagus taurus TaxID=166361 RepID=UPI0039BE5309